MPLPFRPPTTPRRVAALTAAVLTALLLSACGGGDGGSPSNPGTPGAGPTPELVQPFEAVGSSARTVSLAWTPSAETRSYAVERRRGSSGEFSTVATVDARSGAYLDSGLDADTTYSYRLSTGGATRSTTAAKAATTTQEQAVVTARGAALGEFLGRTLGTAGGQITSGDGQLSIDVPPGALAADTPTEAQPVVNTAPAGRGDAIAIRMAAAPRLPLVLKLRYAAAQDDEADGLRIAVQRPAGDWTSLPLDSIDKDTRTLQAQLPPEFLASSAVPGAASVVLEFHIVKYLAFSLKPLSARVKVGQTLELVPYARVRGYDTEIGSCVPMPDGTRNCIMQPMLEEREMPFTNEKPGYNRSWWVSAVKGGNATVGTITPKDGVGAIYRAPAQVPQPSTVRVLFHSINTSTLRQVDLVALVDIWDDAWTGTMTAIDGPSSAGTTLTSTAHVRWLPDAANSIDTLKSYRGEGQVDVAVTDDNCSVSIAPDSAPLMTDVRLVQLQVDESRSPMTYQARLITFWMAQISASCPGASTTRTTQMAGWGWEVQGRVSADGRTIEGSDVTEDGHRLSWKFSR
jgi:hypothetical protein